MSEQADAIDDRRYYNICAAVGENTRATFRFVDRRLSLNGTLSPPRAPPKEITGTPKELRDKISDGYDVLFGPIDPSSAVPSIASAGGREVVMRHLADWRDQQPMQWLVDGFIPDGETVLIHAPMGSFKSFIAADLALSIASGNPAFGRFAIKRHGPVVCFIGEGRRAFEMQRTEAWFMDRGFDPPANFALATVQGVPLLGNNDQVHACFAAIDREFAHAQGGAIIIDPYTRCIVGMDENGSDTASIAVQLVEDLKERFRCSVVMIAHEGLETGRSRGSTALSAGFDNVWSMKRAEGSLAVELRPVRLKDGPEDQSIFLQGRKVLSPVEGERAETLIFDLVSANEYRSTKSGKGGVTRAAIIQALQTLQNPEGVRTIVLAEAIHAAEPKAGKVNAIRQKLDGNARGSFSDYVANQGDGTGRDPRTWTLPSLGEHEAERGDEREGQHA